MLRKNVFLGLSALAAAVAGLSLLRWVIAPSPRMTLALVAVILAAGAFVSSVAVKEKPSALISLAALALGGLALGLARLHLAFAGSSMRLATSKNPFLTQKDLMALEQWAGIVAAFFVIGLVLAIRGKLACDSSSIPRATNGPLDLKVAAVGDAPIVIRHKDRYLHTLVAGTTGTGKTSRVLKPMIYQDLLAIKRGLKAGITVIEPKGDLSRDVADMAVSMGIPVIFLDPEDAATAKFNPLEGDAMTAAEIMRTVLQNLFGRQEAFFSKVQEQAAKNVVLLLKMLFGDRLTMQDMLNLLRDQNLAKALVERAEALHGQTAVTDFFRKEALGDIKDKFFQFALGLRLQLEDIVGNSMLQRVLLGKSDVDLDKHLAEGGVLVVNTAMGPLGKLGDAFGQFIMMHLQYAVFRRPGTEQTRTPHFLYVDEFPRYVNQDFERLLAIGRSFRCATTLALQTTDQLVLVDKPAFRGIVISNCRNKVVLNLENAEDAKLFAQNFGEREVTEVSKNYANERTLFFPWRHSSYNEREGKEQRFDYTALMELPKFHAVSRIVRDDAPQEPVLSSLDLSPWDKDRNRRRVRELRGSIRTDLPPGPAQSRIEPVFPKDKGRGRDSFFE
ncbi:MAG: type IV secretory system conjugative DNA transfer family protein [Bacillota bacterium]